MTKPHPRNLFFFFLGLGLIFGLGLFFLSLNVSNTQAANVNVAACVPDEETSSAHCTDGVDNDCDGRCDYVGGSCSDGSTPGDSDCPAGCVSSCGNSVVECAEVCDPPGAATCTYGACKSDCTCPPPGGVPPPPPPPPPPPCTVTCGDWGPCVGGSQQQTCVRSGSCTGSFTNTRACAPVCGNSVKETGEECDDGNTANGDGCSAACQLEVGCGNGVFDAGEQCDDNNLVSGDCCSATCQREILITNVSESVTNTTATISWQTPCQAASSLLEWGKTAAVNEGSVSVSGTNYSYTIAGLQPNTVYYYRITATAASLQAVQAGSFLTLGGVENCTNSLDDDKDGFCDYPASTCTDGSVAGDPECVCSPNFVCTTGPCQANEKWTVNCVDSTIPKCRPDYQYEESCEVCPGVTCGPCQQLNEQTCTCENLTNCCGNTICEPPQENPYNCQSDCPAECLSDWECTVWSPESCPPSGIQTRECFDKNACQVPINPPANQQSCSLKCPGLTCGPCQKIDIEQCICQQLVPCCGNSTCESGENYQQCPADCVLPCQPNWTCLGWGGCQDGISRRECYDLNKCDLNLDRPPEVRSCLEGCEAACNLCQNIDLANCTCAPTVPCCGNHACESPETVWSCPVDCGLPPELRITLPQCLDGLDNDADGSVDYPADTGCNTPVDNSELNFIEILQNTANLIQKNIKLLEEKFLDNPLVEQRNETFAAPALITTAAISTFATFSFFNFLSYLRYLVSQPLAVFFRRRRKKWGIVYNALTKQPVDLAIVRLYQQENGRLIQSRVTDRLGRYNFLAPPGRYYLAVTKPNYNFPTLVLKDKKEDVKYLDLYHGEIIQVTDQQAIIVVNIPLDPAEDVRPPRKIIFQYYLRKVQYGLAFSAVPLAGVSAAISPGILTFSLFGFHCLLYVLFRRLGYQRPPKSWGIIYDKENRKPIGLAVTRIYDKQYNKLLETRVTDTKGRYAFLVDNNIYYLTAEKIGYRPEKISDIDLISKKREAIVGLDVGLDKMKEKIAAPLPEVTPPGPPLPPTVAPPAEPKVTPTPPTPPPPVGPVTPPPTEKPPLVPPAAAAEVDKLAVGRQSLEELMKAKKSIEEIKEEIEEEKEDLEQLEEKVEKIEENVDKEIQKKEGENLPPEVFVTEEKSTPPEKKLNNKNKKPEELLDKKPEAPKGEQNKPKPFKDSIFG